MPDMVKEKISECIDMVRSIEWVAACALVSRDGIVAGNYFNSDLNKQRSGAFLTILPSSTDSVGGINRMESQESIAIRAQDSSRMVSGAGENFLLAAILNDQTDPLNVKGQMLAMGGTARESM